MSDLQEQKQQLVQCIRMLEQSGIVDYNGHASIRLPGDQILINIGNRMRSTLTVDDLCIIDFDGELIEGDGKPPLEFHLHAGVYKSRPDIDAAIHCHPQMVDYFVNRRTGVSASLCPGVSSLSATHLRFTGLH